jgi:hypothetical protein
MLSLVGLIRVGVKVDGIEKPNRGLSPFAGRRFALVQINALTGIGFVT